MSIILGCTDPTSCNYNLYATLEDNTCWYPLEYYNCEGNCINDVDMDGECDEQDYDDGIGMYEVDSDSKKLIKMIDVLGRQHEVHKKGMLLFYVYDNGLVEKKVIH